MNEKIPDGFTPETWEKLTPEQKQVYLKSQGESNKSAGSKQDEMMKNIQKMTIFSTIFGAISSFLPNIIRRFFRD